MALASRRWGSLARFAAGPILVGYGLAALVVARDGGRFTTYAGRSQLSAALALAAGLALGAAGVWGSMARPTRIGDLALAAAVVWFAPVWVGWADGPPAVRSVAMVAVGFAFPLLLHLVLAYPSGRVRSGMGRALVAAAYVEAAVSAVGRALFRDPFADLHCWDNCRDNVFLVRSLPRLARAIELLDLWFALVAGVALAALFVGLLARGSGPGWPELVPVLLGGGLLAAAEAAHAVARVWTPVDSPSEATFGALFVARCGAVLVMAVGVSWGFARALAHRRRVGRIVAELGEVPVAGSLEPALARAVGDPSLRIAYWLPDVAGFVDAHGRRLPPPAAGQGRTATSLVRDGRQIAVVSHASTLPELERQMGAAVRLALENERLQAEVLAQLQDLRTSRARIVETGDAERRRLERDLHDGAQQRILSVSLELRLARSTAEADGDAATASALADATREAQAALSELRELAQGIHPAILSEAGLGPALATLAEAAPVEVQIDPVADERHPAPIETAAYLTVAEAMDDAVDRGATRLGVRVVREEGRLVVTVEDDGAHRTSSLLHLADRVGALGGTLAFQATVVRAEIPCA